MRLQVLGCSGGIGKELHTTSFLIDDSILIDCGTGIGTLDLRALKKIRNVFLTHSHLDHIAGLPLLIDTIFDTLTTPLTIHGSKETIEALQKHIFNNAIWPDFAVIPSANTPVMQYNILQPDTAYTTGNCTLEMVPVNHVIPANGYYIECSTGSFAFSGDTTSNDCFWDSLNNKKSLDYLFVESAFPNREIEICKLAYHYCPQLLSTDLKKLKHRPKIYISHLKPGSEDETMNEILNAKTGFDIERLQSGFRLKI
jgi:cAMP phosphodiesterase